jgi:glycosyltransferase involved in cell wall biosynthesis
MFHGLFKMIKVSAITGNLDEPSARFRVRQYINSLSNYGVDVTDHSANLFGRYPPSNKIYRPFWGVGNLIEHIKLVLLSNQSQAIWLQREFLSTYFTLERFLRKPVILDLDDAIFAYRDGKAVKSLAKLATKVICGNNYLAEWISQYNKNIHIIPTAVDTNRYIPHYHSRTEQVIVWSGSGAGLRFLYQIEEAFVRLFKLFPNACLRVISNAVPVFKSINKVNLEFIEWSPEREVDAINSATVGIMPLNDDIFTRGKCAYKMLTYMSCAIPVVVSPIGMNNEILNSSECGYKAVSIDSWVAAISDVFNNRDKAHQFGINGRNAVVNQFDKEIISQQIANVLIEATR